MNTEPTPPLASVAPATTCYALPSRREGSEHFHCEPGEATHLWFWLANEDHPRCLPVQTKGTRAGTGNWTWNGDREKPTLRPSLATNFGTHKCHVWINDGLVQHLVDCTCGLAGQTQRLAVPDVEGYFSQHNDLAHTQKGRERGPDNIEKQ